ncbi:electron transfer flavoprotein subunit YgcR [Escherichia coli]|nr:electron transfer flavoprotein subunit YgcR [Escherichia coli]
MAAGKAEIIRKTVAAEMPAMQCLQLARAEQRRGATLIDGQTGSRKKLKSYGRTIYAKGCSHEYRNCDNKSGECRNSNWLAAQDFSGCTLAHWQIEPQPVVAEQVWMRW